jgi:hypothetical protein
VDQENAPATKRDFAEFEQRLSAGIKASEERQSAVIKGLEERIQEQMRDMQTELLKAFLPWQENLYTKFTSVETNTAKSVQVMKDRIDFLERRLWQIEKKLLLEPPAA